MIIIDEGLILAIDNQDSYKEVIILTYNHGLIINRLNLDDEFKNQVLDYKVFCLSWNQKAKMSIITLISWKEITTFKNIFNNNRYWYAYNFNKLILQIYEKINSKKIYDFLLSFYHHLNDDTLNPKKVYGFYLCHSFNFCGLQLNLISCLNCHWQLKLKIISFQEGQAICHDCYKLMKINCHWHYWLTFQLEYLPLFTHQEIAKWKINDQQLADLIKKINYYFYKYGGIICQDLN